MDLLLLSGILIVGAVALTSADPGAKQALAEAIDRFALWSSRELKARAKAQRAARSIWKETYRQARGAGVQTQAAPAAVVREA